ncbi:hypothetical protein IGI04_024358 [Brassica rapa subsp. trilocularis]|uniref:Protein kinase domain-containing protein n=1 Tax=Brassica rapa subsp. trilocularis TaxID=1813537 RepID=A0ABQ7M6G7_BRACM|nr:hypothetical protein IGI04_024358 [Brassica rapa subsp. trilocularis]
MRNVVVALRRHRRVSPFQRVVASHNDKPTCSKPVGYISRGKDGELGRRTNTWISPFYLQHRTYSTEFTSVHGGRPTAEYAKLRRESLETEFGQALGAYSSKSFSAVYRFGPFLALYRAAIISFYVVKLTFWQLFVQDMRKRAVKFRETLISLGPFYIKLGQALSTRADILPSIYCQELSKLQDQIPPFPNNVAMRCIEEQLGAPVSKLFADISPKPVAAASLGQVYKAHLHSGQLVAVKVQRPGMSLSLTRDALLFHMIGGQLKRFAKARKDLLVAVNEMVRHMFDEIDYVREAKNAERFASLYSFDSANDQVNDNAAPRNMSKNHRAENIKVPKIYWNFTRTAVLTMEWVDGIKLTDEIKLKRASLDRRDLIDQGLSCSLKQLLEVGFFHADPHPGNLVATKEGSLVYFDFGMMGNIPRHYRVGLIQILVHFVNRDSLSLANDFLSLGFLPEGVDIQAVSNALRSSFGSSTRISQDFQGVMEQLYDVMYDFNFSLPPDYALVIRSLGSLEGTAKILDPEFKVIESAYPFVIGRLLADPSPDMRKILRELVICNDGSIRWNRLERLVAAISEQASVTSGDSPEDKTMKKSSELKSFDMHSVVSATEDLLLFILSEKGQRVRVFLLQDIIRVVDIFLEEEVLDLNMKKKQTINLREEGTMKRVSNGFKCLNEAVKLAPGMWTAMLLRMSRKPEVHSYALDIVSALCTHLGQKMPNNLPTAREYTPGICNSLKYRPRVILEISKTIGTTDPLPEKAEHHRFRKTSNRCFLFPYLNSAKEKEKWDIRTWYCRIRIRCGLLKPQQVEANEKFSYGYASSAGKRSSMEDFFETRIDGIDGEIVGLFGVFDGILLYHPSLIPLGTIKSESSFLAGHGGAAAAEYLKRHLFSNLITHPNFISDTKSAIADAYNHTDSELLKSENNHTIDAGSTASTAILVRDRLLVANVGDSRAVICRAGTAFAVSRDHKPDQSDERERIENAGGFVMWAGTWRVGGVLAVSRSFGDRLLKEYVIADPEIQEEKIDDSLEFLILASDGLWDVFSNEEAVEVVKEVEDPEESTKKLVGEAIKRGSADNITCVVVRFLESKNANSNADASSSQEIATNGQTVVTSDAEHNVSANETNQDHTAVLSDLDQKPTAVSAAGRSVPSEQNGSAGETNQVPSEIHRGSEPKSSSKQPSQGHITVHNNMDESVANQKPVIAEKKAIAATNTTSSEQSGSIGENNQGSIGENNQKPTAVHSDSATSKSSNVNSNHY